MTGTTHFDLAEVIARCGLVGFNGEVYDVTMPGFLKERFIIKDNFCSCGRTDCIHLFAVRVAIEQNCVTDSTQNHAQGRALGMGALATPSQLGAINVLAQSKDTLRLRSLLQCSGSILKRSRKLKLTCSSLN